MTSPPYQVSCQLAVDQQLHHPHNTMSTTMVLIVCFHCLFWLILRAPLIAALSASGEYSQSVYFDQYTAGQRLDQAAYESPKFWQDLDDCLPNWRNDRKLERFRGFCDNLRNERPGREVIMPNGQQLLAQYVFPGLSQEDGVERCAYPAQHYSELQMLEERLTQDVAPVAQREMGILLENKPLVNDEIDFAGEDNDGDTWQRAAWYGWQFLSLRGAKRFMPETAKTLKNAMENIGPAHRFVGLARQKQDCVGVEHSDERNYMLSTLTPVSCPPGCGIVVDGEDTNLSTEGNAVILDNSFLHHVYNESQDQDRFCLMAECWHPALTIAERNALATLFAAKDRFTVVELQLAPWGYDDDDLGVALETGAVHDLDFWKDIVYDMNNVKSRVSAKATKKTKKNSSKGTGKAKGFAK